MAKAKQVLFRRSHFLVSYWNDKELVFENYATGKGATAAPIAKHVLETFFAKKDGKPLPSLTPEALPTTPVEGDEPVAPPISTGGVAENMVGR